MVPTPAATVDELRDYIKPRVASASAAFYAKGTPRYFSFIVLNEPEAKVPEGDIDGFCELIVFLIQRMRFFLSFHAPFFRR